MGRDLTDLDGVPSGATGGGLPINATERINNTADNLPRGDHIWLKTGVIETDLNVYPDALVSTQYTGFSFTEASGLHGIAFDGTNLWVVNNNTRDVTEFDLSGVPTGNSFNVQAQTGNASSGITWDGTHFWVTGRLNDAIYKYDNTGTYTGTSFSVNAEIPANLDDLTWDGTFFYVLDFVSSEVFQYDAAGTYTGLSFFSFPASIPQGILWDGTRLIISSTNSLVAAYFDTAGNSLGVDFPIIGGNGIAFDGTHYWFTKDDGFIYQYIEAVGIADAATDPTTGYPIYVRVQ